MSDLDLTGLEREYSRRLSRLPAWVLGVGLVIALVSLGSAVVRGAPTGALVYHGVIAIGIAVGIFTTRHRQGEQVTRLEPTRAGTGTRSWRGHLELTWTAWADVEEVKVPGPWQDDPLLVLRDGAQRTLPGVSREDVRTLARALAAALGESRDAGSS